MTISFIFINLFHLLSIKYNHLLFFLLWILMMERLGNLWIYKFDSLIEYIINK
jgi:hypothetical protein